MARRHHLMATVLLLGLFQQQGIAQSLPEPDLRHHLQEAVSRTNSFNHRFEAEVWLVDMAARLRRFVQRPLSQRLELLRLVHQEAHRAQLQPELVLALIHAESHFDRFAVSPAGAQGLMQVMPFWKSELGRHQDNLTDNATNLRYGCTILSHYLKREKGNLSRALARYNGSLGQSRYPNRVLSLWRHYWYPLP